MIHFENRRKTNSDQAFKLKNQLNSIKHQNKLKRQQLKRLKEQSADVNETVILETSFACSNGLTSSVLSPRMKKLTGGVTQEDLEKIKSQIKKVSMKMLEVEQETDTINYRLSEQKKQNLADKTKKHDLAYLHRRVTKNLESVTNAQRNASGFHLQSINALKSARDSFDQQLTRSSKILVSKEKERDKFKRDIQSATANISRVFLTEHK